MSRRNSLANKAKRRAERANKDFRNTIKQSLNTKMNLLAYDPPDTFEELEAEIVAATEQANQE